MHTVNTRAGTSLLAFVALSMTGSAQPIGGSDAAVQAFQQRVAAYVEVHRRLEGPRPTLEISEDLREVHAAMEALARELRNARRRARQGDLFTPDVTGLFRTRIASCLPPGDMAALLAEHHEDLHGARPRLRVNGGWPPNAPFGYVPPEMLAALPPLPSELQYRIVGRSLVLWDHHANLIVDFIRDAFPTHEFVT